MYDFVIILSRFLFIIYIAVFLLQGVIYILNERELYKASGWRCVSTQRVVTVFMHLTAFLILAYNPGTFTFKHDILIIAALGLVFLLVGHFAVDRVYKDSCPLMWNGVFFLMDTGLILLTRLDSELASKQLTWFVVGFVAMLLIPPVLKFVPRFEKLEKVYLVASLALLAAPLLFGDRMHGALNWIEVAGIRFQPSELTKFLYVFYLASVFRKKRTLTQLMFPAAASALLICVLAASNDMGGALIFFMTFMSMLYIATGSNALFALGLGAVSAASVVAYRILPHIQTRVAAWSDPWADLDGQGYQIARALFAIGTWGPLGSGLTRGLPLTIPVVTSDFIFAAICEELGILFGLGIIAVFMMIFYRGTHIALRCTRRYYSLLAAGFTAMLAFQTFLIIGGVTKLIPLTGVTLPFVSHGGSSVVISIMMAGILQWVFIYNANNDEEQAVSP